MPTMPRLAVVVITLVVLAVGCSTDEATTAETTTSTAATAAPADDRSGATSLPGGGEVVSEIYGEIEPSEAPGYTQYLYHVEIPPGVAIDPHTHPGQQVARIQAGTLTYTVIDGTLGIGRDGSSTPTETVTAPTTVTLEPGDTAFEPEGMVHEAANEGDVPVEIVLSSLFASDQELSIPRP